MHLRNGIQVVLQYPNGMGGGRCRGFAGLPITSSHYILIDNVAPSAQTTAHDMGEELACEILALAPTIIEVKTPCFGRNAGGCHALDEPDCKLCFVPVVDMAGTLPFTLPAWCGHVNAITVPAVVPGTPQGMVPPSLRPLNQIRAVIGDKAVLHDLLRSIGILSARPRIFISYLRSEASVLAEQLYTELVRKGFEIFLDRFSVSPGADFQKRLDEELIRMGTVLFVESKNSHKSRWIRHETDFALLHRLGTIALTLPDGKRSSLITPDDRLDLDDHLFTKSGRLKKIALEKILLKIAAAQALSENMRTNYLTGTVSSSLAYGGFVNQSFGGDQVIIAKKGNGPEHVVRVSGLPAELQDFHALDPCASDGDSLIISPGRFMNWRSKDPIEWLSRRINVKLIDESEIAEFPGDLR